MKAASLRAQTELPPVSCGTRLVPGIPRGAKNQCRSLVGALSGARGGIPVPSEGLWGSGGVQ